MSGNSTFSERTKSRLPGAALAGFCAGFMFFFFGALDIFANNRRELLFSFSDFGWILLIIALGVSLALSALVLFLPGRASDVLLGVLVWLCVMGYIQGAFLNGSGSLSGDTGGGFDVGFAIFDAVLWVLVGAAIIFGAIIMKKKTIIRTVFTIALAAVLVMQITGCVMQANNISTDPFDTASSPVGTQESQSVVSDTTAPTEPASSEGIAQPPVPDLSKSYLTVDGLCDVSSGKNVVVFVLDRFDVSYYEDLINYDPNFFDRLDGFTYFGDNISTYSRTYPGVVSMVTGVEHDPWGSAAEYFSKAYGTSTFLKDLKANNFKVKIYTQNYYAYKDGTPLYGIVDNISYATDYTITDRGALVANMLALSTYRYLPTFLKGTLDISTSSFTGIVDYNGEAPMYELDDPSVISQIMKNGLVSDGSENTFTFLHLLGAHDPYITDENGDRVEKGTSLGQLSGDFGMIFRYIDELKRLDLYDNATIIITGDHPRARDDAKVPAEPRLTALFVKAAGDRGALKISSAQVSQQNLIPTIIESAGIKTVNDYGRSYFSIMPDENTVRYHNFELYVKGQSDKIITFKVTGKGDDFSNWEIAAETDVDIIYK